MFAHLDLLIATSNAGKVTEIRAALAHLPINFYPLTDFPDIYSVEESGATYEENAVLKARGYAQQTGLWALADDSGLEVAALSGDPGVHSARYAGASAADGDRVNLLLGQLDPAKTTDRSARFVCVIALADQTSTIANVAYGECTGRIIEAPLGEHGFGYDPIFIPAGYEKTFAELPSSVKDVISHRARALQTTRQFLAGLFSRS